MVDVNGNLGNCRCVIIENPWVADYKSMNAAQLGLEYARLSSHDGPWIDPSERRDRVNFLFHEMQTRVGR